MLVKSGVKGEKDHNTGFPYKESPKRERVKIKRWKHIHDHDQLNKFS